MYPARRGGCGKVEVRRGKWCVGVDESAVVGRGIEFGLKFWTAVGGK